MEKIDKTPEQIRQEALEAIERDRIELAKPENVAKAKKKQAFERLTKIFSRKRIGLKRLAVDKPWMDDAGVSEQYENYKDRYQAAKQKAAKDRTDIDKIVIQKFEEMAAKLDPLLTLLDAVKSKIAAEIEAGSDVSAMLDAANAVRMEEITPEEIEAIKQQFGV